VDSKAADAFGQETLGTLGRFTKLVSGLIKSYTDKYDLLLESELLNSIRRMHDKTKSDPGESTVLTAAAEEASRLVNWDCLSIVMYADTHHGWVLQRVVNRTGQPYVAPDQLIDFDDSIVGKVIKTNQVQVVDDMANQQVARFYRAEKIESSGAFLCVPISSLNRCYGALALESKTTANFTGIEVETIYRLVENAAAMLEVLYMNDLVKEFVIVDQLTGGLTEKYFKKKIEEEVRRAEDFGTDLTQVSVAVDRSEELVSRYGKDGLDAIVNELVKIMRNSIRPYDVIGRSDPSRIGVLLIQTAASDAYVWAEKIRKQIASHIIGFGGKSFSVTVSIGVCGLTEGMLHNELMASTAQVLSKAMESGGNLVRIY
jgi:diguanylate cyclase (GGDEF)-like protein